MNPKKCPETEKNNTRADFSSNCYAANLQFEAGNPDIPKKHIFIFVCIGNKFYTSASSPGMISP